MDIKRAITIAILQTRLVDLKRSDATLCLPVFREAFVGISPYATKEAEIAKSAQDKIRPR